jgi:P4 family phage/plasmid primase-like protien
MEAAFERALQKIPLQLREQYFRFVPILNGRKKPEGKRWTTEANYPYGHGLLAGYLAEGHNYGVLTGVGGLVVLDVDDLARLEALGIIGQLPETFTVRTGRGGLHFYFLCSDLKDKVILEDPELKDCEGDPLHLGELQALGQQVVGPGSRHPNGNFYEIVKNLPIATIEKAELMQILSPLKQAEVEQARNARRHMAGGSYPGDLIPIDQIAWPKDIKERCGSEVRGSHPLHGSTSGKNFAVNTSKNCWYCFRHKSGGGPLEWLAVEAGLISCQDAKPGCLDKETFKKALQNARDCGFDIPAPEKKKEEPNCLTVIEAIEALASVCDHATSKDGAGFSKFDREEHEDLIDKAINDGDLSAKEEKTAIRFLKKYKKQLKGLGVDYEDIGHIRRVAKDSEPRQTSESGISYNEIIIESDADNPRFSPTLAADAVLAKMDLRMSKYSDDIFRFNGQIFTPDGERVVDCELCCAAEDLCNAYQLRETVRRIKNVLLNAPAKFDFNPYLLGVKNGVADLLTGQVREYRREDLITAQIDVTYDPSAKCPQFLQFLEEVCPNFIDRLMLVDWYTIHAIRSMFPYVMFLNGLGRNGKGIYERVLKHFYGEDSFSHMPLEELTVKNNRFAGADLAGKRGQIVAEAGESHTKGKRTIPTAFIKNATGDGIIDSDQKNKGRIKFKPFYKTTIDANDMPRIEDTSKGWIERFCKADMPYHFVDHPLPGTIERKKDPDLFDKLTTERELSGILNLIIDRAPEIIKTKTITKRPGAEMFAEYQRQSSSITTFLETFCDYNPVSDSFKDIFLDIIFSKYEEWCDRTVADKVDAFRFGKAVKTFCKGIEPERVRDGDKKRKIYHGLSFDVNRYQAQWDQYKTNEGPIKTVTGPMGPINGEKTWEYIREKFGPKKLKNIHENGIPPNFSPIGPDGDSKNTIVPDSGAIGPQNQFTGPDGDLSTKNDHETAVACDCGESSPPEEQPKSPDPAEDGATSPAEKARLWDSIRSKLKKCGRVDGKRRGLAVADLQPEEAEAAKASGWQQETTSTGISILWATEKSIAAMGLEAPA